MSCQYNQENTWSWCQRGKWPPRDDSNVRPFASYHYGFHHRRRCRLWSGLSLYLRRRLSLLSLGTTRQVSARSTLNYVASLRIAISASSVATSLLRVPWIWVDSHPLFPMGRPMYSRSGGECSIQLSYGDIVLAILPATASKLNLLMACLL